MSARLFTPKDLRNCYISMRSTWVPFAYEAIDRLMRGFGGCPECTRPTDIVGEYVSTWDKVQLTNLVKKRGKVAVLKCSRCGHVELLMKNAEALDQLRAYLWDQDCGLTTIEEAVTAMAGAKGLKPDPEVDWVGDCYDYFTKAWNKEQASYMRARYGLGKGVTKG